MMISIRQFLCVALLCPVLAWTQWSTLVNTAHLSHLTESVKVNGTVVDVVHVYANYPEYHWVAAAESGPEGIACVDDAARAAVFWLRLHELRGDPKALSAARPLLEFVIRMECDDGQFFNFILGDHSINKTGKTSFPSFGWWASRGIWAMAQGYCAFRERDPQFAARLAKGIRRALPNLSIPLRRYGQIDSVRGLAVPRWLPYGSGADVSSELVLGLMSFYTATHDTAIAGSIRKLLAGMMMMQDGDLERFPYGAHRSWETMWHMWGNGQTQALALCGLLMHEPEYVRSGVREARGLYARLLIEGFLKERDLADSTKQPLHEQIAYSARPMAIGCINLFNATHDSLYLTMAGLTASWLMGNNEAGQQMFDPHSGRCFDGIREDGVVNKNAGAESTIEALMTLLEVEQYPRARSMLMMKKSSHRSDGTMRYANFSDGAGNLVTLVTDRTSVRVIEGEESRMFQAEHP